MVTSDLRACHGPLLGACLGPFTVIPTFAIASVSWASTGSGGISASAPGNSPPVGFERHSGDMGTLLPVKLA